MQSIFHKLVNRKVGNTEIVDVDEIEPEEERYFLPSVNDNLDITEKYNQIMFFYEAGIRQITTKLEILNQEFQCCNDRNPIENIKSRIKSPESIKEKMERKGLPFTVSSMVNNIRDIAGVRIICPFISDVYHIAGLLLRQDDIDQIEIKDYIKQPKENGYRSLHLIVMADVYFSEQRRKVPVEIQLRTIAMEFWASIEHQIRYKKNREFNAAMQKQLKQCAEVVTDADLKMQDLAGKWL